MTIILPIPAESGNATVLREIAALRRLANLPRGGGSAYLEIRANGHVARLETWWAIIPGHRDLGVQPMIQIERVPEDVEAMLDAHPAVDPVNILDGAYRTWLWPHTNPASWRLAWRAARILAVSGSVEVRPGVLLAAQSAITAELAEIDETGTRRAA